MGKRHTFLAAVGWQVDEIKALTFPAPPGDLEAAMCESGELRRLLREVTRWFPEAKVVAVRATQG